MFKLFMGQKGLQSPCLLRLQRLWWKPSRASTSLGPVEPVLRSFGGMHPDLAVGRWSKRYLVNRGVAEGALDGCVPSFLCFSNDSLLTSMLEGASELDHQIQQAYFTSMRKQGSQKVLGAVSGHWVPISYLHTHSSAPQLTFFGKFIFKRRWVPAPGGVGGREKDTCGFLSWPSYLLECHLLLFLHWLTQSLGQEGLRQIKTSLLFGGLTTLSSH